MTIIQPGCYPCRHPPAPKTDKTQEVTLYVLADGTPVSKNDAMHSISATVPLGLGPVDTRKLLGLPEFTKGEDSVLKARAENINRLPVTREMIMQMRNPTRLPKPEPEQAPSAIKRRLYLDTLAPRSDSFR